MKILYVITKSNWGGAQRYVYDLAIASAKAGHQAAVAFGGHGTLAERLSDMEKSTGVRIVPVKSLENNFHIMGSIRALKDLRTAIRAERPDVLHLNSSKAGILGVIAGRLAGVRNIIFTIHGWPFAATTSPSKQFLLSFPIWITILLSKKTIAVSHATRDVAPRLLRKKIQVIQNGITCAPNLSKEQARKVLSSVYPKLATLPKDTLWIGTIAELHPVKGLRYAFEAINTIRNKHNVVYVVLGEGNERIELEKVISAFRLEKEVMLPGFIPNAASLLPAFDIVLHPSLSEALAYAVLEAGCAGSSLIASSVGGIPEIVTDGTTGLLIAPAHPTLLANAIETLANDTALRKKIGSELNKITVEKFSRERMEAATAELYKK